MKDMFDLALPFCVAHIFFISFETVWQENWTNTSSIILQELLSYSLGRDFISILLRAELLKDKETLSTNNVPSNMKKISFYKGVNEHIICLVDYVRNKSRIINKLAIL